MRYTSVKIGEHYETKVDGQTVTVQLTGVLCGLSPAQSSYRATVVGNVAAKGQKVIVKSARSLIKMVKAPMVLV